MFSYETTVRLQDTDATGVIYFSQQFKLAMEAFEQFLKENQFSLGYVFTSPYLLPVVHAEADYVAPLRVDDEVVITLRLAKVGTSSFTLFSDLMVKGKEVGVVSLTHAVTLKETGRSTRIPEKLLRILQSLPLSALESSC